MSLAVRLDPVDGPAAREAARRELEQSGYHRDDPGLVQRVLDWIGDRLGSLLDGGPGGHAILLLLALAVIALVVLAVRAGPLVRRHRGRGGPGPEDGSDPLAATDSRAHRRAAERWEAEGRPAEAMREWLRAALATVEERGVLPPRPGRTGLATAREAGPLLPTAAPALREATAVFEQVFFGGRPATDGDVRLARTAADAVARGRVTTADPSVAEPARW